MKIDKITPQIAGMLIGQKAELFWDGQLDRVGTLIEIQRENEGSNGLGFDTEDMGLLFYPYSDALFLLRSLKSITEQEAREVYEIATGSKWKPLNNDNSPECIAFWVCSDQQVGATGLKLSLGSPSAWLYLLSKGFDLFGLIDAGLAKEIKP